MGRDVGMNMGRDVSESIRRTKQGFEESFQADSFYNQQKRDEEQLNRLLDCLNVENGMKRSYEVEITADEIWITERVNNLLFQKKC